MTYTLNTSTDTRLIELADLLAAELRQVHDAFEALEARNATVDEEFDLGPKIIARADEIAAEMMQLKPATFLGFVALEMARRWKIGE